MRCEDYPCCGHGDVCYTYNEGWDMSDVEADSNTLVSVGWGTDEDYGYYGGEDAAMEGNLFGWDA